MATPEDVEAFGVFNRHHVRWVLGFLARRLGDAELAADVTSEVFAAALRGRRPQRSSERIRRLCRSNAAGSGGP